MKRILINDYHKFPLLKVFSIKAFFPGLQKINYSVWVYEKGKAIFPGLRKSYLNTE